MTAVFLAVLLFVGPLLPQSARAEEFFPEGEIPEGEIPEDAAPVPALDLNGLGCVFLGDVLPLVYPELSVWDVAELTELVPYDDSPAFVNVDDPAEIIPLSITDAEGNDVICLWDEFTGERTVELFIHVSADNWARAALGGYAATIGYRAAVE